MTPAKLREAMKMLGFAGISEVAIGADLCTIDEARGLHERSSRKAPLHGHFLLPGLERNGQELFPDYAECISMTMTPMVLTARLIKKKDKDARICFVGPCSAKKLKPAVVPSAARSILC